MSVGKEWEIPLRQTQKFCPKNCFYRCGSTKNAYTEKSLYARHGPFFQVLSHMMINISQFTVHKIFIMLQNFALIDIYIVKEKREIP